MKETVQTISLPHLALAFIPVLIVVAILWKWNMSYKTSLYGLVRMLVQLLLMGYFLAYIFEAENAWVVIGVLSVMLFSASWIGLRTLSHHRKTLYFKALISIVIGGGLVLILVTQGVLGLDPWYMPNYLVPLAGMIFANAMNSVSLAGERVHAEMSRGIPFDEAKKVALQASLIPIVNMLFAVGLVSLPGMMTGQILSGISPFIAARYQIMVMCMAFGSAGLSSVIFLTLTRQYFIEALKGD